MHTQATSTSILSSNSHDLSYNTRHLSYEHSRAEGVSTILQILIQTNHPIHSRISRDLSYNARKLSYERTCPARVSPILQISGILKILIQTNHPILSSNSRDLSYNTRKLSYERTCPAGVSPILEIPKKSCKSCFRQSPQPLVPSSKPNASHSWGYQKPIARNRKTVPSPPTLIFSCLTDIHYLPKMPTRFLLSAPCNGAIRTVLSISII